MNAFWAYFWPLLGAGLIFGIIAGAIGFWIPLLRPREELQGKNLAPGNWRRRRTVALGAGALACIAAAALWHGPFGAAERFVAEVERSARQTLVHNEIPEVTAHLHRGPLTRRLILSGPADDFQRGSLVQIIGDLPGVSSAQWSAEPGGEPLILDGIAVSLLGFLFGLLVAYLVELRRRHNFEWNW